MADVRPFRGLRYNPAKVAIGSVVTQPYDKITPQMQAAYYEASPCNVVRLILGRKEPGDDERTNVYTRAADFLGRWMREGVLVEDAQPAVYASSQTFAVEGRTVRRRGFVALLRLSAFGEGVIFPHERTFQKYKDDRLRLMRTTRANLGHVFMLYSDPTKTVSGILEALDAGRPDGRGRGGGPEVEVEALGVRHTLTPITDADAIETVREVMADKPLFIADGHHRYETAVNYRDEMRAQHGTGGSGADAPYDWRMVTLINMEDEALVIRPTHRLVRNLPHFDRATVREKLAPFFAVEECAPGELAARLRPRDETQTRLALYTGGERTLVLTLADRGRLPEAVRREAPGPVLELDVTVLHGLILDYLLGMPKEQQGQVGNIWYVATFDEGLDGVRSGQYQAAFFLNPTRIAQVRAVAASGAVMPQKSTDFYPKLLTGLVMRRLAD
jgi:uncharacterized protein (DUF1015 family)